MTKIERRRATVILFQGNYEQELANLFEAAMTAERLETISSSKRMGTKSEAGALARQYDTLLAEANSTAVKVTVWALSNSVWGPLADEHPPRDDVDEDKQRGLNMKTFPPVLLRVSLVAPDDTKDDDGKGLAIPILIAKGESAFDDLGDLSRLHYVKLERAAWNVNVGDEDIPKFSLVSLLKQQRDLDSKLRNDSE